MEPLLRPLNAFAKSAPEIVATELLVKVSPAIVTDNPLPSPVPAAAGKATVGLMVDVLATVKAVPVVLSFKLALATSGSLTKLTDVAAATYAGELNPVNLPDQVDPAGALPEDAPLLSPLKASATLAAVMVAPVVLVNVKPAIVTDLSAANAANVTLGLPGVPSEI